MLENQTDVPEADELTGENATVSSSDSVTADTETTDNKVLESVVIPDAVLTTTAPQVAEPVAQAAEPQAQREELADTDDGTKSNLKNGEAIGEGYFADWNLNWFGNSTKHTKAENTADVEVDKDGAATATLKVESNQGKVASTQDGIVFLNKALGADDNFTLKATVTVDAWTANNQVAFGLMMRPAVGDSSSEAAAADGTLRHLFVGAVYQKMGMSTRNTNGATGNIGVAAGFDEIEGISVGADKTYELVLQKKGNEITVSCDGVTKTATIQDSEKYENVIGQDGEGNDIKGFYVGLFVARNCKVTFSDVNLQVIPKDTITEPEKNEDGTVKFVAPAKGTESNPYIIGNTRADIDLTGFSAQIKVGEATRTITGKDCAIQSCDFTQENGKIVLDYVGLEIEIPVVCIEEVLEEMTMTFAPTKTDYFVGDSLDKTKDLEGLTATVKYNSGVTKDVLTLLKEGDSATRLDGFDTTSDGKKTVTISHEHGGVTLSKTFDINVSAATLASITLSGPTQTTYYKDVTPETDAYKKGLRVIAKYSDDSQEILTNMSAAGITISPSQDVDVTSTGDTTYTVTYQVGSETKTATYTLSVVEDQMTGIQIKTYPDTTTFAKGASFDSTGLEVVGIMASGTEKALTSSEYSVDSSLYQKDTVGSYEIKITSNENSSLTASYLASVVEKTSYGYADLTWDQIVFGQSCGKDTPPVYDAAAGTITVEQKEGKGKVTDAGQDGIAYYYTTVNADQNFVISADVTVDYFITKKDSKTGAFAPDNQEGFGIMVRDAIGTNGDASIFYSNAATVGGYYGRYNVYGRHGITDEQTEKFTNFYLYAKTNDPNSWYKKNNQAGHYAIPEGDAKTFKLTIGKDNTGIWATMEDEDGKDVLAAAENKNDTGGTNVHTDKEKPYRVYMDTNAFTSIEPDKIYVGFMAARGAKITVDASTIDMQITEAASDAPQEVLPEEPVVPSVSVASLLTAAESEYNLKVSVNTPGLLTVKVNGETVKKQLDITAKGTVEVPVTLVKGNNAVQCIFEPDPNQNITSSDTVTESKTIVYKTYGEAADALYIAPDGSSSGDGTKASPLDFATAVNFCQTGQTIYALGGTYSFGSSIEIPHQNNGTADAMKELVAAPDNTEEVVFDFGGKSSTFAVSGDYWHVKGISVTKGGGMRIGGNHNLIELCKTYDNTETGMQISRTDSASSIEDWPSYNTILNCDSYNNRDSSDNNADGFAAKLTSGVGNEFRGCVAYYNVDDGWDLFAKASAIGAVKLYDCVAYANGFCLKDGELVKTKGDGNGFKLGGSGVPVAHEIHNSISFGNKANGFTNNSDPIYNVFDCIGYNNGGSNLEYHAYSGATKEVTVENFASFVDDTMSQFSLLSGVATGSDTSEAKGSGNFLYDKKTGISADKDGVQVTADNFASLADFAAYCNNLKKIARDAEGNLVLGGFLKFTAPTAADDPSDDDNKGDGNKGDSNSSDDDDDDNGGSGSADDAEVIVNVDWNAVTNIIDEAAKTKKPQNVDIQSGDRFEVPVNVLNKLVGTKVTLALHAGGGLTFSISGSDIKRTKASFKMAVSRASVIPQNVANQVLSTATAYKMFSMEEKTAYPFLVNVHVNLGAENAGKMAYMYYYDEKSGSMRLSGSFRVTAAGQAMFALTRGDEYIIVVAGGPVTMSGKYIVASGDNLSYIAKKVGTTLRNLIAANPQIKNINMILPGQEINVP